jgi:hypothetical protein
MKVGTMTAAVIHHGLILGWNGWALIYFTRTFGSAEMPGPSESWASGAVSKTILTGTRCTTLMKLPVAFSAGTG